MRQHLLLVFAAAVILTAACSPLIPTPDDFPQPPWTPIVEFPTVLPPTSTPRPALQPIYADDVLEARNLLLLLQVAIAAGDSGLIAERILYPVQVTVGGRPVSILSPEEFEQNYEAIFGPELRETILGSPGSDLAQLPDGVKAAGGALWFNQFCTDAACSQSEFLITRINN